MDQGEAYPAIAEEDGVVLEEMVEQLVDPQPVDPIQQQRVDQTILMDEKLRLLRAYGALEQHRDQWLYVFQNRQSKKPSYGFTPSLDDFWKKDLPKIKEYMEDPSLVIAVSLASGYAAEMVITHGKLQKVRPIALDQVVA